MARELDEIEFYGEKLVIGPAGTLRMKALGDEALKREKKKYQVLYSHCVYCVERERETEKKLYHVLCSLCVQQWVELTR